jgi:hypothetical protein
MSKMKNKKRLATVAVAFLLAFVIGSAFALSQQALTIDGSIWLMGEDVQIRFIRSDGTALPAELAAYVANAGDGDGSFEWIYQALGATAGIDRPVNTPGLGSYGNQIERISDTLATITAVFDGVGAHGFWATVFNPSPANVGEWYLETATPAGGHTLEADGTGAGIRVFIAGRATGATNMLLPLVQDRFLVVVALDSMPDFPNATEYVEIATIDLILHTGQIGDAGDGS